MPSLSPQYRMADRLAGGELAEIIRKGRSKGLSWDSIAARLYADHYIEVTGNTVQAWAQQIDGSEP